jgi:hypothetical protein
MSDDILGGDFSSSFGGNANSLEIDLDRAASAFPELDDGSDFATAPHSTIAAPGTSTNNFAFDDFDIEPPVQQMRDVKVTGDDEIEKFEDQFPDIEIPQVLYTVYLVSSRHSSLKMYNYNRSHLPFCHPVSRRLMLHPHLHLSLNNQHSIPLQSLTSLLKRKSLK